MNKPFVIGLAGATGSGKSTLAAGIKEKFCGQAVIFHLDDYFIKPSMMPVYAGVANYDDPRSLDYSRMIADIKALMHDKTNRPLIIVEGFLLLHYPEIRELLDLSIFLEAPHEISIRRRIHDASAHYRSQVIKPMYEKFVKPSTRYADFTFDIASQPKEAILDEVMQALQTHRVIEYE